MKLEKTAIQQMVEWILEHDELFMPKTRLLLLAKASELLEIEKEQIITAWSKGYLNTTVTDTSINYFNETFNQ